MATAMFPIVYTDTATLDDVNCNLSRRGLAISGVWRGRPEAVTRKKVEMIEDFEAIGAALKLRVVELKHRMGAKLVGHPEYRTNARHSVNPEIYNEARRPFLDGIAARAKADREKNPAFIRAQAVSAAVSAA